MKKRLLVLVAALTLLGVGPVMAEDYVADPPGSDRCQEVGDDNAGDNDDNGLQTAVDTAVSAIEEATDDRDCDNSGGRRP